MFSIQDDAQVSTGEVDFADLLKTAPNTMLLSLAKPVKTTLSASDNKEIVIEKFEGYRCRAIPVLDAHQQIVDIIRFFDAYHITKKDLASDMQTMVGVSKDERASSSNGFAFKKRMPWLQISLLTAFAATAEVFTFGGLILEITARLFNGLSIDLTCSLAVYLWRQSIGLSLVIGLAMVSSLVIADVRLSLHRSQ